MATIPPILARASLLLGIEPGLHWLLLGSVFAAAAGVMTAWVPLVEILR